MVLEASWLCDHKEAKAGAVLKGSGSPSGVCVSKEDSEGEALSMEDSKEGAGSSLDLEPDV